MHLSQYYLPVLKETPADAQIVSHRLMLRAGMIRQTAAGIYAWLPLGYRVLRKLESIVHAEQEAAGALPVLMPTIQAADLWRESGRYEAYGKEMLRIQDRHGRDMLYGPTNEEVITDIFRTSVSSYKELPKILYQIQWKFRDEVRPRFGVMRGREFFMKDGYSFDLDQEAARDTYNRMFVSYLRTFAHIGIKALPVKADSGPIGGDMTHEFVVLADNGESDVFVDRSILNLVPPKHIDYTDTSALQDIVKAWTTPYARTDETHDAALYETQVENADKVHMRGIEVGHIFNFGTKYSEALGAKVIHPKTNTPVPVEMGSYGIGVSRLVGAIIEASHDENGIIWPDAVAPFDAVIVNLKQGDEACDSMCDNLYTDLRVRGLDVLYDDRRERAGAKFATADLIGCPVRLTVGPKGAAKNQVEITWRKTQESDNMEYNACLKKLHDRFADAQ